MKVKDIVKKSDKELEKAISSAREELASFKRERYVSDERNVRKARNLRRDLARMLTVAQDRSSEEIEEEESK